MNRIIVKDTATPALDASLKKLKSPRPLLQAAGKAVEVTLRDHFKARQAEGNKKGWPSRGFWYGEPDSVATALALDKVTDTAATVVVADRRFVHKVTGGTIQAKRSKFLAIPLRAEAYALGGKGSLRESQPDLFPIRIGGKSGRLFLAKKQGNSFRAWFRLVRQVTQKPDPKALPDPAAITTSVEKAVAKVMPRLLLLQGGPN